MAADDGWRSLHVYVGNSKVGGDVPNVSHSQHGQDRIVASLHAGLRGGFYVDVAANDAVHLSNTLMLERDLGWSGVCVEANPRFWFRLAHRRCAVVAGVVSDITNDSVTFNFVPGGMSGIRRADVENHPRADVDHRAYTEARPTVVLWRVLRRVGAPRVVDYMSLDVEGSEHLVLRSLGKHIARVMTVERGSGAAAAKRIRLLRQLGYLCLRSWFQRGQMARARCSAPTLGPASNVQPAYFPPTRSRLGATRLGSSRRARVVGARGGADAKFFPPGPRARRGGMPQPLELELRPLARRADCGRRRRRGRRQGRRREW